MPTQKRLMGSQNASWIGWFVLWLSGTVNLSTWAQESVRNVDQPGTFKKYLTPGTVDRWIFNGKQGELVMVAVRTTEFDAILKWVQMVDDQEHVLLEVDDEGSHAHAALRLPADGVYKIQVHGYELRGGGNYGLTLENFSVVETQPGQATTVQLDAQGRAWLYFSAAPDSFLSASLLGGADLNLQLRDWQGLPVPMWANLAHLVKGGEYFVRVAGPPLRRGELQLTPARRAAAELAIERTETLPPNSALILDLPADGPPLALLEMSFSGDLASQVVTPPNATNQREEAINARPAELQFLPAASKGSIRRFAVLNRPLPAPGDKAATSASPAGRSHQLQLATQLGAAVTLRYADPRQALAANGVVAGALPVGGSQYFQLAVAPGDAVTWTCRSSDFDSELRLYDGNGRLLAADDDGGGGLDAQLRYLAFRPETLLLTVTSVGNGGGGEFQLQTASQRPESIEIGQAGQVKLAAGEMRPFALVAKAGQKWLLHGSSPVADSSLQLLNADGVEVRQATGQGSRDVVLVHEFAEDGNYTLVVRLPQPGDYQLRVLSGN
jgi:hypothetical protein